MRQGESVNDKDRDALIEELRRILYKGHIEPRVTLRAARNIIDLIPQRHHIDVPWHEDVFSDEPPWGPLQQ